MLVGITTNDLKRGMTLVFRDKLHEVVDFAHIKPGKGHAFVRVKLKNIESQSIFEHTFNSKEKVFQAIIEKRNMEFIYRERNQFYFMDQESFEQLPFDEKYIGDKVRFLRENTICMVVTYEGNPLDIVLPDHMDFEVVTAEDAVKGDTATNVTKNVQISTGATIRVPQFINAGDRIRVDTRTGDYIERVK